MRRLLACLSVLALAAGLTTLAGGPAAQAISPVTGKIVDITGAKPPVVGATVRLRALTDSGGPGAIVASDTTDSSGKFALDAGPSPDDEYYVQVVAGEYQGGFVGGDPLFVQPSVGYAATYGPHASLGKIWANPAFIRGTIVDSVTKKPLRGIKVAARSYNDGWQTEGVDYTNRAGAFSINGIECEDDCYLRVDGSAKGYEVGYRGCYGGVVPTWGDACASPIGRIGKVRLDKD
ncbi:carboxypeptidase-like regulatory domain-containing protein [Nocardioides sp.]|uniref:carboxypeptidase-like regulatory domain-containing protein n=1 Tax=Nocardioides sp. TaxID=35761 RepID=UPI00378390BF